MGGASSVVVRLDLLEANDLNFFISCVQAIGNTSNEEAEEIGELISIPSPAKNTKKRLVRQG